MSVNMAAICGQWTARTHYLSLAAGVIQVLPANPLRLSVIFCQTGVGGTLVNVSIDSNLNVNNGLTINTSILVLDFVKHPGLVGQAWWAWTSAGANLTIIEEIAVISGG